MNKEDFPILLNNKNLVYLDSSATSLKPKQVIDEINNYYNFYTANLHRGDYDNAITVNKKVEETRVLVKEFLNAKEENEIIFTSGTTESLNMIVFSFMKYNLKENDEVLLTKTEHASNVLPWLVLEREIGIKVKYIPLKENLTIDYEKLEEIINDNTKLISIAHITNTIGDIRNLNKIRDIINNKNIPSGIYNFADDQTISTNRLIEIIAETLNRKPVLWALSQNFITRAAKMGDWLKLPLNTERLRKLTENYVVSNDKIKSALGIEKLPLPAEEGLVKTIKSFKTN